LRSELGFCKTCALDGSSPSDAFFLFGHIAVACLSTAIAAGVAFFAIGIIFTHFF